MLYLSRYVGQQIRIGDDTIVRIHHVIGGKVCLGIEAPKHVEVHREEVWREIRREKEGGGDVAS